MFLPESLLFRVSVSIWWLKFPRIACSVAVGVSNILIPIAHLIQTSRREEPRRGRRR